MGREFMRDQAVPVSYRRRELHQIQNAASPASGLFRQRAAHQRMLARQEALPNVRRLLQGSAETWEALANSLATQSGNGVVVHTSVVHRDGRPSVIRAGGLIVDLSAGTAGVADALIPLTRHEYAVLTLLALRKGQTVTKAMLLDHLYGGAVKPATRIIEVFVCKLRKKLSRACGGDNYIQTIRGRGYSLVDPSQGDNTD